MRKRIRRLGVFVAALACANGAFADANIETVRTTLAKLDPKLKVAAVQASSAPGLYQVSLEGTSGYITADGRYFIVGDMYELPSRRNLSEEQREDIRLAALKAIDRSNTIEFIPANPKHVITVFTDVDCGYCRKLHGEMAQLNALGIGVRYLAYPRSGAATESWHKMESVWCSSDRGAALTRAKAGETIAAVSGCAAPQIATQYELGKQLGVQGTPTIITEEGTLIGGYLPPARLLTELDRRTSAKTAAR